MDYPWLNPEVEVSHLLSGFTGSLYPFQKAGVAFLASVKKGLLLDQPGLGKTVQALAAFNLIKTQKPSNLKLVIVTLASTQLQWVREAAKFFPGLKIEAAVGKPAQRYAVYEKYIAGQLDGIVIHYSQLIHDMTITNPKAYFNLKCTGPLATVIAAHPFWVVLDEIQKIKNVSAKTSKAALWMSEKAAGIKGLTATPVYNHLIDIYGIFKVIEPGVFSNKETFKREFCTISYAFSPYGQITGYKNHRALKERIKHFTLGRNAHDVKLQLPPLIPKIYNIDLNPGHRQLYQEILDGFSFETEDYSIALIGALQRAQVCVNAAETLSDYTGKPAHPKLDEAVRLVQEEFEGQKIVIFSKLEQTISVLDAMLKAEGIRTFRITGQETQIQRDHFQQKFMQESDQTTVMLITAAGGAGLNLQAASTLIMVDRPWSMGELTQIRGRLRRIGSPHDFLLEVHLVASGTIDEHVINLLGIKETNVKKVFGDVDRSISATEILESLRNGNNTGKCSDPADSVSSMSG